jgi:hypothetical protein
MNHSETIFIPPSDSETTFENPDRTFSPFERLESELRTQDYILPNDSETHFEYRKTHTSSEYFKHSLKAPKKRMG